MSEKVSLIEYFEGLEDPRMEKKTDHKLVDIIVIAICAVICGADKWTQVEEFGKTREKWLRTFLELPNGIPSHDTFGRVFALIGANKFQEKFQVWTQAVFGKASKGVIAIDGKTLRRSYDKASNNAAIHIVHAWATAEGVLLGQQKTAKKSNEITAIPELLDIISVNGCIVTIDAMGCQKNIAEKVKERGGDYVLAVKGNQGNLEKSLENTFEVAQEKQFENMVYDSCKTIDSDHGRVETRECYVLPLMYLFKFKLKWKGLQSLVCIKSERVNKSTGEISNETRYYISSLKPNAQHILQAVRSHWGVENNLHWCLDVGFREDECRSRIGDSAENFSLLRKIALTLIKKDTSFKGGIQSKRLKAAWDLRYLLKILGSA